MNPIRAGRCEERSAWRLPPQRAPGIYDGMRTALVIALTILLASCGDDSSSGTAIVDAGSRRPNARCDHQGLGSQRVSQMR